MRFLMVTTFYPPHHFGGDALYVRQLADALRSRRHTVDVVYCYDAYRISGGNKTHSIKSDDKNGEVVALNSSLGSLSPLMTQLTGNPILKGKHLADVFGRPYDVVHFHNLSLIGGPGILSMSKAPVTLFTAHEHWTVCATHIFWKNRNKACDRRECFKCQLLSGRPPQLWRYTNHLAKSFAAVDQTFAPSRYTKHALESRGIGGPIDVLKLFAPSGFEPLAPVHEEGEKPSFLYVGRVTRSKGVVELMRLFEQRPQYNLSVVGDGDLYSALACQATRMPNVTMLGEKTRAELPALFRQATACILPSLAPESFGLATIEAFSQGTPAIVRDSGGAGETIRETGGGFVFTNDDEALEAIDKLATDSAYRDRMGTIAREEFLKRYTEERHVDSYLEHISRLMLSKQKNVA